ncbi:Long-chain fatty acid transport protein 1-like protein, partial [Dinothrombium tinctorium]
MSFITSLLNSAFDYFYILFHTLPRDLKGIYCLLALKYYVLKSNYFNFTISKYFEQNYKKHPEKVALICDDRKWTFKHVEQFSNQVANYFSEQGLKAGDEVALFMPSRAEFAMIFLALTKIGVVTAFINENLRLDSLIHSISCIPAKAVIFDAEFEEAISEVYQSLSEKRKLALYCYGALKNSSLNASNIKEKMREQRDDLVKSKHSGNFSDVACYVYTSGTTGLPKASIIRHSRYIMFSFLKKTVLKLNENDVTYIAMPLYHTLGGIVCVGSTLITGQTLVIRRKFSASNFWEDCLKYKCTNVGYIGEVCRYILDQPPKETDKLHTVRKMFGAGLRPTIWRTFVERFHIESIFECYGSTEGNASIG